jgi:hypothetical protein
MQVVEASVIVFSCCHVIEDLYHNPLTRGTIAQVLWAPSGRRTFAFTSYIYKRWYIVVL